MELASGHTIIYSRRTDDDQRTEGVALIINNILHNALFVEQLTTMEREAM